MTKIKEALLSVYRWFAKRGKQKNGALVSDILFTVVFVCYAVFMINTSMTGRIRWSEIDSNLLPIVSIQYRGTIILEQEDIEKAAEDFGGFYQGIETYDDLRSAKLVNIDDDHWLAYYYPAFPASCIPLKLIFEYFDLDLIRAVTTTSALFVLGAVGAGYYGLKAKRKTKWAVALLMMASPAHLYVNYLNYECFVFGLLGISLVLYYNQNKKASALALSFAGMANSAVMGVGIVMVIRYLVFLGKKWNKLGFKKLAQRHLLDAVLYALCFVPSLIPFIVQNRLLGKSIFGLDTAGLLSSAGTMIGSFSTGIQAGLVLGVILVVAGFVYGIRKEKDWILHLEGLLLFAVVIFVMGKVMTGYWERMAAYLVDPTIGYPTFAPVQIVLAVLCLISILIRKNREALVWPMFFIAAIMAVSLMNLMNVGMLLCSRYVFWIYPALAIFLGLELSYLTHFAWILLPVILVTVGSTAAMINYNLPNYYIYYEWRNSAVWLLDEHPDWYQPWSSLFAFRTSGGDWSYERQKKPIAYFDSDESGEARKLLVWGTKKSVNLALDTYCGDDEASEAQFIEEVMNVPLDGKAHYIDILPDSDLKVRLRTLEDTLAYEELDENEPEIDWTGMGVLPGGGIFYSYVEWMTLEKDQLYRVDVEIPEQDLSMVTHLVLELFNNDLEFDQPFTTNFVEEGVTQYTFYYTLAAEDWPFKEASQDVMFRLYAITYDLPEDAQILVDSVVVTKLSPNIGYR